MKKIVCFILAMCCSVGSLLADDARLVAFPGAEGYGRYASGGRGGEVCYVTRLDDCSDSNLIEGTLRWALRHDNGGRPRTVLFAVSGTIYLTSKLKLQYPNVSILGQSAPGGGICLTGYNLYICRNNVIVRYIRFRAGDIPNTSMTGLDIENCDQIILDHCSMTWSMEECLTAYDTDSTTIQWCIMGEGLYSSKNAKGGRAYACQWGGEHSTMHHTLITNSHSRSPRFNGVRSESKNPGDHDQFVDSEFANNVVYNWCGAGGIYGGENYTACNGYDRVYMIGNYYRPGPATKANSATTNFASPSSDPNTGQQGEWYLRDNKFEVSGTFAPWSAAQAEKVNADNSLGIVLSASEKDKYLLKELPYALSGLAYEDATDAYTHVVSKAGASLPRYDEVDRRLLDEAAGLRNPQYVGATLQSHGDLGIIDGPDDIKLANPGLYYADGDAYRNYPSMDLLEGEKYAIDSDADGLPDAYEDKIGLNKNDAADAAAVTASGYTQLEMYMNGLADGTLKKSDYETSAVLVKPGSSVAPTSVKVGFKVTDAAVVGRVPADIEVAYGSMVQIPENTTLYKAGYMLSSWTGSKYTLYPGQQVMLLDDVSLLPVFKANTAKLSDRTDTISVVFDAATLATNGIVVTKAQVEEGQLELAIQLKNDVLTLPHDETSYAFITYADGTTDSIATATTQIRGTVKQVVVVFPYYRYVAPVTGSGDITFTWTWAGKATEAPEYNPATAEGAFSSVTGAFCEAGFSLGSINLGGTCVSFLPKTKCAGVSSNNYIEFVITPIKGMRFKATSMSFKGAFKGTSGGNYTVTTFVNSKTITQKSSMPPSRDALESYSVTFKGLDYVDTPTAVRIFVYNLNTDKTGAIREVVVKGAYTDEDTAIHQLTDLSEETPSACFDLMGRRVSAHSRGMVIENGRIHICR